MEIKKEGEKITNLFIVRHGETSWNALDTIQGQMDIPLNERGMKQARECASYLADMEYDIIITSPLQRARQTAEIINQTLCVPLIEMEEFVERYYGNAQGMTKLELQTKYPDKVYPNMEARADLRKRVMAGLEKITQSCHDKRVLLIAHGAVINTILATVSSGKIGSGKTKLINACISNILFDKGKWEIKEYNRTSHLTSYRDRD